MAKKLTLAEIKKQLGTMSQPEMVQLICQLYKEIPAVSDAMNAKFCGDEFLKVYLAQSKAEVKKQFFPARGMGKLHLREAKACITAFKKLYDNPEHVIDLQLYYVECGVEFTNTYGDIYESFYSSIEGMYYNVVNELNDLNDIELYRTFSERLRAVVDDTAGIGWGFHDGLTDSYLELQWVESI